METANVLVRLGGDIGNAVPKNDVTPAEILVLKHVHGSDAVLDVRPTGRKANKRHEQEYDRLASIYDRGAGEFVSRPGEQREGVMARLFPGAMKRLPTTLAEVGYDFSGAAPVEPEPVEEPIVEEPVADEATETEPAAGGAEGSPETAE